MADRTVKETERVTKNHVFFYGGYLSNFAPAPFVAEINGEKMKFHTSEQCFMYLKAIEFGDKMIADRIMKEGDEPSRAKGLGRVVMNYDDNVWSKKRYDAMLFALYHKFTQNENCKQLLLSSKFEGKHFVEGSPTDGIWGIKCYWLHAADDKSNWEGENLLGKALDEIREKIISENA